MMQTSHTFCITGGTGSFGRAMTEYLLKHTDGIIRIYSRSELLQAEMQAQFGTDRVRYLLGDVRDIGRLQLALHGVDCLWHSAALKHVDKGEYDPAEFVATNINGTLNVITACIANHVKRAILISSDKAISPINTYGSTKMTAERVWTRANGYSPQGTIFTTIRYGNVMRSRGSVIPLWEHQIATNQPVSITDLSMSRFYMALPDAIELAWFAGTHAPRGSILVPHLYAYTMRDLLQALCEEMSHETVAMRYVGVRPGEKYHEHLLTDDEGLRLAMYSEDGVTALYYCVCPATPSWKMAKIEHWETQELGGRLGQWHTTKLNFPYASDSWPFRLDVGDLRLKLRETRCTLGPV